MLVICNLLAKFITKCHLCDNLRKATTDLLNGIAYFCDVSSYSLETLKDNVEGMSQI